MKIYTLNRHERLKSRKAIEILMKEAETFHVFPVRCLYRIHTKETKESLKLCVSVSKKRFKHAVDRNRIKGQMREAWRLNKNRLVMLLNEKNIQLDVMLIYTSKEHEDYSRINKKILLALGRLEETINKFNVSE